ncbi:hypothetical protein N0V90_007309 [Kalmusia sp. IMI 367209]|nr:hypothetical protein N0V90_007309 [Kalmusia sp. IMI 367209]
MPRLSRFATAFGLATLKGRRDVEPGVAECHSYGMDFQSNGYYFQNSLSNDYFTFVEQFEDCNPDVAYNVIVDPTGNQNLCTETSLTPDDVDMLSTCPLRKNQLVSGNWSIIVISNNGDGIPLAAQRDFVLSVGPQITSTVYTFDITKFTATKTASCKLPTRPATFDRRAVIVPTVGPAASIIDSIGLNFRRDAESRERFLQERAANLALVERAPDPQPLIVTEANTEKWPTSTATSTGSTITATITSFSTSLATLTPPPVTVFSGKATASMITITASTPTQTIIRYVIATVGSFIDLLST